MAESKFNIEKIDFSEASDEMVEKMIDYNLKNYRHQHPRDPLPSRDVMGRSLRQKWPFGDDFTWIVSDTEEDIIVAAGGLGYENQNSPAYEQNKQVAWGGTNVLPEYRKKRLGSLIIDKVVDQFIESGREFLQVGANEEDGKAFIQGLGIGEIALEGAENRLYMEDVDWDLMRTWIEEGEQRAPDVTLKFIEDEIPDEMAEAYVDLLTRALNSIPKEKMEWEANETVEALREKERLRKERGGKLFLYLTVEKDGAFSGMTDIFYHPENNFQVGQGLTAILPEYRGRGLGKLIKAKMLMFIRENMPDVLFIRTGNASVNAPMLSINKRMGFKTYKEDVLYKFRREELRKRFNR